MPINNTESTMRTDYSDEWHQDFERTTSLLKQVVNSRGIVNAKTITFDVAETTGTAVSRQRDGELPYTRPDTSQLTKDLEEHHAPYIIDDWDAFRNNSQIRSLYQQKALAVCNRKTDEVIISELDTTTSELSGSAVDFSTLATFLGWLKLLREADVPMGDGNVWGLITPAAELQMNRIDQYRSADYVNIKPMAEGATVIGQARMWMGVKWLVHTGLTGFGGTLAQNYLLHSSAVGHMDDGMPKFFAGTDEKHGQHWCRGQVRHCAKAVLPRGIVRAYHNDDAAFA